MNPAQSVLSTGFNAVFQMPTGSGKTWQSAQRMADRVRAGKKAIYLTPTKALAAELFESWSARWPDLRVSVFTGDQAGQAQPTTYAEAGILVMTPEKLDIITRQWRNHWIWIPDVDILVVDELHLLRDANRGGRLEGTLLRWRSLNPFSQVIGLSATLGNAPELAQWLNGVAHISLNRPVPLQWRTITYRRADEKPRLLLHEIQSCVATGGKSIVFVQSKRRAEALSAMMQEAGLKARHHHAGLKRDERRQVEESFRARELDIVVATATLEVGMNMPARQVILFDLQQFDSGEFKPLSVISAWQRAGRAGRPGLDTSAEAILFRAHWEKDHGYERGQFEPIQSQLSQPHRLAEQIIVSVASRYARSAYELERHFTASLASIQRRLPQLGSVVNEMVEAGFLVEESRNENGSAGLAATKLGRACARLMIAPQAMINLRGLLACDHQLTYFDLMLMVFCLSDGEGLITVDFEELPALSARLGRHRSRLLHPDLQAENVKAQSLSSIVRPRQLISAIKSALCLSEWTEQGDADAVAELMNCYPGDIQQIREVAIRMLAGINTLVSLPGSDTDEGSPLERAPVPTVRLEGLRRKTGRLNTMVEKGLNSEVATLTLVPGIGGTWARRLSDSGICHIEDLAQAEPRELTSIGRISEERAAGWIQKAGALSASDDLLEDLESAAQVQVTCRQINTQLDVYRIRRSWSLIVQPEKDQQGLFHVSGGADPHAVQFMSATQALECDCKDHIRGNVCKHILAVRRHLGHQEIVDLDRQLLNLDNTTTLDLVNLWAH